MRDRVIAAVVVLLTAATAGTVFAQTNVVTNGSFETSAVALTGWTTGPATTPGGTGTCGFNAAAAPGTETATGTPGFAAAHGSNIALGSTATTAGANYDCVVYQDVAIPAGATTATFSGSWGVKLINGLAPNHGGVFAGIYATTKVPNYLDPTLAGTRRTWVPPASDAAFTTFTDTAFNVSALAGTTVRLALHIVTDQTEGRVVAGFDNIQLLVTTAYRVIYDGNGSTGGTVPTDSGTYATGATVTVKANTGALVRTNYVFNGWNTAANGSGTSYAPTGSATFSMGSANVTLYARWSLVNVSGSSPTGTGPVTASFIGGDAGCGFSSQQFIPLTGDPGSPPAGSAPAGVTFPHGLFIFTVSGCTAPGGTLTFTVTYPQALPTGTQHWKYGPTPGNPTPSWYPLPAATVSGNTVTFSIIDGGLGDNDLTANGTIVDPGGPGVAPAVPTMGEWAMIIMTLLLATAGVLALRRRPAGVPTE